MVSVCARGSAGLCARARLGRASGARAHAAAEVWRSIADDCHGDPHLGNLLIGADHDVWLIDWDDAFTAPRERPDVRRRRVLAFAR